MLFMLFFTISNISKPKLATDSYNPIRITQANYFTNHYPESQTMAPTNKQQLSKKREDQTGVPTPPLRPPSPPPW